ncbi:MAG: HEAT repeat domain-containing protein [Pyrinomonadaceae bacterium]|nr:HEAT repeat domain-containing protein [Pyrinomonadaceae bacterium]
MTRNYLSTSFSLDRLAVSGLILLAAAVRLCARTADDASEGSGWGLWMIVAVVVVGGFGMAIYFWRKAKAAVGRPQYNYENRYSGYYSNQHASYDIASVDAEKELEWLRKAKKPIGKRSSGSPTKRESAGNVSTAPAGQTTTGDLAADARAFQEKMRRLQYSQLPINSFTSIPESRVFEPLPLSDDPSLLTAIEQANEEYEDDEAVRDLAVRILMAFKTQNSVEALSQIALYDLSSSLRSRAVTVLAEFDHESVFETIVLASADPTREVRAAAARGLFRLSFDRAAAWKRIIETDDAFRLSHAARAAIEAGIVEKGFERLVHDDIKIAYEAFVLTSMLINAGETSEVFDAIRNHRDERVRFALLHTIRLQKDPRTLDHLHRLQKDSGLTTDVAERVRDAIMSVEQVAVH